MHSIPALRATQWSPRFLQQSEIHKLSRESRLSYISHSAGASVDHSIIRSIMLCKEAIDERLTELGFTAE
jgi:hypothetical protein